MRCALLLSLLNLAGATITFTYKNCNDKTHGKVTGLDVQPPNPVAGDNITVTATVAIDKATTAIKSDLVFAKLFHNKFDGCNGATIKAPLGIATVVIPPPGCPLAVTQTAKFIRYVQTSKNTPKASTTSHLEGTDQDGEPFICVDMTLTNKAEQDAVAAQKRHSKGYKRSHIANDDIKVANLTAHDIAMAPDSIDWTGKATTSVNDQGDCGSCWAFSTTEGVESAVYMSTGKLPQKLSSQELVACEKQDDGCDGGDIPEAVSYLKKKGMDSLADYPDTSSRSGKSGKCKQSGKTPVVKVTGMQYAIPPCNSGDCSSQNEEALAAALAKYGPLSICINSGDGQSGDWEKYKHGVLKGSCKAKANLMDHCVQLVGYDKTASQPYWKIRNSWNTDFGEQGFIRIPYGNKNACCVGCEAVIISATTEDQDQVMV